MVAANEENNVKLSIYIPENTRARFKSACALHRKSMNQVLVDYIEEFLKKNDAPTSKEAEQV